MNLIAAVDLNWAIGRDGDQLCYIPADLKRFQALTTAAIKFIGLPPYTATGMGCSSGWKR